MGCSRRGVGRGLALVLLLACFASVNSSEHHDSSFRGDAVGARHGDAAATAGADAIPAVPVSRPAPDVSGPRTSRAALGKASKASKAKQKGDLDVHALRRRAEELEDAMYDEDDAFGGDLDEPRGASDPLETAETGGASSLLEISAAAAEAAEAEARAFDEAFPELVRFQDEDEDAAGARSAAFHRRAEEAQTRREGTEEAGGTASSDEDALETSTETSTETSSTLPRTKNKRLSSSASAREKKASSSSTRAAKKKKSGSSGEDDSTHALIELLTTARAPPAPRDAVASGGFPSVVLGATTGALEEETKLEGWQLTWSDEFDGDELDPRKWTPRANASAPGLERFGGQQQWYDPSECRVAGGALALRTRRRRNGGDFFLVPGAQRRDAEEYPFVSCWVDTKKTFSQTYGRVEIRARFPDHACPGVWPQHWMLPAPETSVPSAPEKCWPVGGEIDIAAAYGKGRGGPGKRPGTVESGYHFAPKGECGVDGQATATFPSEALGYAPGAKMDFHSDFHTFAVEWDKDSLKYFVDGSLVNELTRFHVPIIPRWPFYLILNTAVSPFGLPEALECERDLYHYVDYVRVYQRATKTVDNKVWAFLAMATTGCLAALCLAACCAMRPGGDADEEEDPVSFSPGGRGGFGSSPGARVDSEDGIDRTGFRSSGRLEGEAPARNEGGGGPNLMRRRRPRPGAADDGGPRRENLRLFDKPSATRDRRRLREETVRFDSGSDFESRSLRDFFAKRTRAAERAPLMGGVALRLPAAADGRV